MKTCHECGFECENDAVRCINCNTIVVGQPQHEPQPSAQPAKPAEPQYTSPQQPQYAPPQYTPEPPYYQAPQTVIVNNYTQPVSRKSKLVAALLCFFFGYLGIHRFYVGKIGTGILWIFTGGCFGIGILVDFIMIICGNFTDASGLPVEV